MTIEEMIAALRETANALEAGADIVGGPAALDEMRRQALRIESAVCRKRIAHHQEKYERLDRAMPRAEKVIAALPAAAKPVTK